MSVVPNISVKTSITDTTLATLTNPRGETTGYEYDIEYRGSSLYFLLKTVGATMSHV